MLCLLLYPPLYCIHSFGIKTIFGYFAADAFYYHNSEELFFGFFTFDGNFGLMFHPLWQYILTILFSFVDHKNSAVLLYLTFFVGIFFTSLGFVFAGLSDSKSDWIKLSSILVSARPILSLIQCRQ